MRIFLKSLKLENFKGIKDLSVDFNNDITNIYADNGLGKTTIFDAYTWLLWDKDSLNRKDFSIKPYDKNGEEIHNLESSVEGVLLFDDTELTLKKIYKEIWTKKRGSTQSEFTGHTTDYYINSVPIKKKEYNDRLATVIDEDNFNLLSNPLYFNQIIDKNKRRSIVLSLIEFCFHDNFNELKKYLDNLELVANNLANAIAKYYGVEKMGNKKFDYEGHWAEKYIEEVKEQGIMTGYDDGDFKPDEKVTRAELAVVAAKILKKTN